MTTTCVEVTHLKPVAVTPPNELGSGVEPPGAEISEVECLRSESHSRLGARDSSRPGEMPRSIAGEQHEKARVTTRRGNCIATNRLRDLEPRDAIPLRVPGRNLRALGIIAVVYAAVAYAAVPPGPPA